MAKHVIALVAEQRNSTREFFRKDLQQPVLRFEITREVAKETWVVAVLAQLVTDGLGRSEARLVAIVNAN